MINWFPIIGVFHPDEVQVNSLSTGQIGFLCAMIHDLNHVILGDLICKEEDTFPAEYEREAVIPKTKQMVSV